MSIKIGDIHTSQGLTHLFGRGMNSELYKLPADKQEMDRLSLQHRIWKLMADGLYPKNAEEAIQNVLRRTKGNTNTPKILDIGSGSGSWSVEMALRFPYAQVVGMDLIESRPSFIPANCTFVRADATTALSEYEGQFDIIQCRSVAKHVPDAKSFTHRIGKALRPGGLFFFADAVTTVYDEKLQPYPLAPVENSTVKGLPSSNGDYSWFARWMVEVTERWTSKARQNTDGDKLHILIREDGQFEDIHESVYYSPIGWEGGDMVGNSNGAAIGKLMVLNVFDFLQSSTPSLLSSGLSEDVVDAWVRNVHAEVVNPTKRMYMQWVITWATKAELESRKPNL